MLNPTVSADRSAPELCAQTWSPLRGQGCGEPLGQAGTVADVDAEAAVEHLQDLAGRAEGGLDAVAVAVMSPEAPRKPTTLSLAVAGGAVSATEVLPRVTLVAVAAEAR